jgi:TatD DNase family protein
MSGKEWFKIMLFDTHTHLNDSRFDEDREDVIQRARDEGVSLIVNVGFNRETIARTLHLADTYDFIYAAIGWHPHDAKDMQPSDLEWIEDIVNKHPKVVAVGEMGLDYYWDNSPREIQQDVFRQQIQLAKRVGKPVIIHDRDAHDDVLRILQEEDAAEVGGVMHCFGGDTEMAKACLDINFYISFGGPLTFKNAKLPKEVAASVPVERLLIETDSPYLAPHPLRGKRNESSYVAYVARAMADIKGLPVEQLAEITTENGKRLFGIECTSKRK